MKTSVLQEIADQLVAGVCLAASGERKSRVVTVISRGMWAFWLLAVSRGIIRPSREEAGDASNCRVFGSYAHIVDDEALWAFSKLDRVELENGSFIHP